ncbi:hypothetical protein GF342_04800 [Candidatus Woesearchaeota archaeon]|nr:hypothetical protein [Candidatus Woesearchaeota archaeon]
MKKRGRPTRSQIRQNIIEILFVMGKGYGYELHKIYNAIFSQCTRESVYYHLRKGIELGEFELKEITQEKGDFSWGGIVEKRYYCLGKHAIVKGDSRVADYFSRKT